MKIALMSGLFFPSLVFAEKIAFKQALAPQPNWIIAIFLLLLLFAVLLLVIARKKPNYLSESSCLILEKKRLGTKTMIFIVKYQQQQFLLADNQHTLAWQLLK